MTSHPFPDWLRTAVFIGLLPFSLSSVGCNGGATSKTNSVSANRNGVTPTFGYEVVNVYPHASDAFTQGLEYHDGKMFESTGGEGTSSLRLVEVETGKVVDKLDVPLPYFAEGITLLNGKIYQLTWQHQVGFIYDATSLSKIGQFNYQGEGWGLTNDGQSLILSDGTSQIRFLDPGTFKVVRTIAVTDANRRIDNLNELEYFNGELYANIWHRDAIAIIDPHTGRVNAWINLSGLRPAEATNEEAVLNGVAYDSTKQRLFVTGKLWPKLFEIRIKK